MNSIGPKKLWRWLAAGAFVGALVPAVVLWPELFDRLRWASSGGQGERADWGEPAFFVALIAVIGALGGAVLSALAWAVVRATNGSPRPP